MPHRWLSILGAINGALVVILGAVGAHALNAPERAPLLQTAVLYHMFHTLALLLIGAAAGTRPRSALWWWSGGLMLAGIILFCGSLYIVALTGYRGVTKLAPFGGTAFIVAWVLLAVAWWRSR
jgi:uncharacterized membrane protein YgdD (TMEM256/DUF423 family)